MKIIFKLKLKEVYKSVLHHIVEIYPEKLDWLQFLWVGYKPSLRKFLHETEIVIITIQIMALLYERNIL